MDKKSEFKEFVKKYPSFASYVQNKNTTWQELYELWDMYGDDDKVFSRYKTVGTDLNNVINGIKNINVIMINIITNIFLILPPTLLSFYPKPFFLFLILVLV